MVKRIKLKKKNRTIKKPETLRAHSEVIELNESKDYEVPDGLQVGKKFKTLSLGQVSSRMNGENVGNEITVDLLKELVRVYKLSEQESPVIIDWNHATSPFNQSSPVSPDASNSLGIILDLELKDDGLYVVPAYNEKGIEVVKNAGGVLWSSPEYIDGNVYSRNGGKKVGSAQLLAITLTPRPAQAHNKISTVTLKESEYEKMDDEKIDEMTLESAFEIINELKQKIKDIEASSQAAILKAESDDDEDKKESLAESKKDDDDDDDKHKNLSESILLNEINQLKSLQSKSDLRIQELEAEKNEMKCNQSINVLLSEGKITPAEVDYAKEAFKLKASSPKIWEMFQSRAANSHVNLSEIGHGASGQEINQKSLDQKIKDFAKDKSVTYSEALETIRSENPQYFNKFYGV